MEDPEMGAASVLNRCEKEGKRVTKWEIRRIIKELRKFRRYKVALEVLLLKIFFIFYFIWLCPV